MLDKLNKLMDQIQAWHDSAFSWLPDFLLFKWYVTFAIFFFVCGVIAYFLPFKYARATIGGVLLLAFAYLMGGRHMHGKMKQQVDELKQRIRDERTEKREQQRAGGGRGPFGGIFGGS